MKALGFIETKGLLAAIVSADSMVKAANVNLIEKSYVGAGLVSITISGDVAAVQTAIDVGIATVKSIDAPLLISHHVIPRPHSELEKVINSKEISPIETKLELEHMGEKEKNKEVEVEMEKGMEIEIKEEIEEKKIEEKIEETEEKIKLDTEKPAIVVVDKIKSKENIDNIVSQHGIEEAMKHLEQLKVTELRALARTYDDLGIKNKEIKKLRKNLLIDKFRKYYGTR